MMTSVASLSQNTYFTTMKPLSLLLSAILFVTIAQAQDTTKAYHAKLTLHQVLRNIIGGPREAERYREHQDSLIRPNLPPEGHHPVVYIDGELGYAFLGVHGFESSFSINYQGDDG